MISPFTRKTHEYYLIKFFLTKYTQLNTHQFDSCVYIYNPIII